MKYEFERAIIRVRVYFSQSRSKMNNPWKQIMIENIENSKVAKVSWILSQLTHISVRLTFESRVKETYREN